MQSEADILEHYMKTLQFDRLADFLNPHLNSKDFGDHFVELYVNRYVSVENGIYPYLKLNILNQAYDGEVRDSIDKSILNYKFSQKSEKILEKIRI